MFHIFFRLVVVKYSFLVNSNQSQEDMKHFIVS